VPVRVVRSVLEVDHVDRAQARLQQRDVVVGDVATAARAEDAPQPEVLGRGPHALDHLGRAVEGVALLLEDLVPVADHVPHHGEQRPVAGREVPREVPRAEQHVRSVEVAPVLAVHEDEVHADGRRRALERIRHAEQDGGARGPVVGAGHGQQPLGLIRILVRPRPAVPVGHVQHPVGIGRPEPRDHVPEVQRVARLGDVGELLHLDRVGARAQLGHEPVADRAVRGRVRDPRSRGHLVLHPAQGLATVELLRGERGTPAPDRQGQRRAGGGTHHRISPAV
jgi:hypothetical protein